MNHKEKAVEPSLERVRRALSRFHMEDRVVELSSSTRTAQEAAQAVGVGVAQIAKSLVFFCGEEAILVIASGANRVSLKKLRDHLGLEVKRADAQEVKMATGFAIGGIPPLGHLRSLRTFIDEDLLCHQEIYAAAGTPRSVFRLTPRELLEITSGQAVDLKEVPGQG